MNTLQPKPATSGLGKVRTGFETPPITFLHAEACVVTVEDQPTEGFVSENDTFIDASGDSDTN